MSTDGRYTVIYDLLAKAKEKEGLDSARLHEEIRKEIDAADKTFGTFLGLVESLQDIIPKERQRFNAAIRALSKTAGLSREHILESTDNQLEELKKVETAVFSALSGFRDELRAMDSRLKETKDQLAELRKKIADLEKEEQEILGSMAGWEKKNKVIEQAVRKVFTDIGAEITGIRDKIEQFAAEEVSPQPAAPPGPVESTKPDEAGLKKVKQFVAEEVSPQPAAPPEPVESTKPDEAEEVMILEFPSKPKESKWAKKCPLCGGQMNFHTTEAMWKCYNCGNEEPEKEDTAGAGDRNDASKSSAAPEPVPTAGSATPPEHKPTPAASEPFGKRPLPGTKTCPVCHKQMNMHEEDKTWNCPFCNYLIREF